MEQRSGCEGARVLPLARTVGEASGGPAGGRLLAQRGIQAHVRVWSSRSGRLEGQSQHCRRKLAAIEEPCGRSGYSREQSNDSDTRRAQDQHPGLGRATLTQRVLFPEAIETI